MRAKFKVGDAVEANPVMMTIGKEDKTDGVITEGPGSGRSAYIVWVQWAGYKNAIPESIEAVQKKS